MILSSRSSSIAVIATILVVTLLVTVWLFSGDVRRPKTASEPVATGVSDELPGTSMAAQEPNAALVTSADASRGAKTREPPLDTVSQFMALTRYAHGTRRIDEEDTDALAPGARFERRQRITRNPVSLDAGKELLFTADRYYIVGDQVAEITLDLWLDGHSFMTALPNMKAEVFTDGAPRQTVWLEVERTSSGAIARLQPDRHWPHSAGPVKVTAIGPNIGADSRGATLDFHFTGSGRIPAEFTAVLGDYIENGSLVVEIGLDVHVAGEFLVTANIHDRDGKPIGTTNFRDELFPGKQIAKLIFDGLLFHDKQAPGPYFLTTLRGERVLSESLAVSERIPLIEGTYVSEDYDLSQFRAAPAFNPRRERMLDLYRDAQARGLRLTPPAE